MVIATITYLVFLAFCGVSYMKVKKADYSYPSSEVSRQATLWFLKDNAGVATVIYVIIMIAAKVLEL